MFKFRSGGQGAPSPTQPPTIEAMRRRARHRLIGASVLVLAGVIGFPLLFDSKPRPIPVDIPIDIPAKNSVKPLTLVPAAAASTAVDGLDASEVLVAPDKTPAAPAGAAASAAVAAPATPSASPDKAAATKAAEPKPAKPVDVPQSNKATDTPSAAKPPPKTDKASDKVSDRSADKAGDKSHDKTDARVVVQVGAFADADRAHDVRQKLEHAGLKTYTHVADTPEGKRIRVRLGPFATRAEADKAAAKVKALGLPAAILTL